MSRKTSILYKVHVVSWSSHSIQHWQAQLDNSTGEVAKEAYLELTYPFWVVKHKY